MLRLSRFPLRIRLDFFLPWLLASTLGIQASYASDFHLCSAIKEEFQRVYQNDLKKKILDGIPFELMSALFLDQELLKRKSIQIQFNLWDETIRIKEGDRVIGRFGLAEAGKSLCSYLDFSHRLDPKRKAYHARVLLNPMWSDRMDRLRISAGGEGSLIGVDWKKLIQQLPSEKILIEKKVIP